MLSSTEHRREGEALPIDAVVSYQNTNHAAIAHHLG